MMKSKTSKARVLRLQRTLRKRRLDGVIVVPGANLKYYTGISSMLFERPFLCLIPQEGEAHLIAPALEAGPYKSSDLEFAVHYWTDEEGSNRAFSEATRAVKVSGRWGVEGRTPYRFVHLLQRHVDAKLQDAEGILQGIREVKDEEELSSLRKSATILSKSFENFYVKIAPGLREDVLARRLSDEVYSNGAEKVDEVLVQAGASGADPHHLPGPKKVERGKGIVIDVASTFQGYYADITRTFIVGSDKRFEEIYEAVLESEQRAIRRATSGATVGEVDSTAREFLKEKKLSQYFIHRTGHGLGLEVHEAPYIVPRGKEILRSGMVFTVEPGVYIPKKLGVRIEDNVVATAGGKSVITDLPKEMGWWR
jgi:Xaa-Pro aminopeptidase